MANALDPLLRFPFSMEEAVRRAQLLANEKETAHGVWEHVGRYGDPSGDIPARHTFKVQSLNRPDPDSAWALVATCDPDGV